MKTLEARFSRRKLGAAFVLGLALSVAGVVALLSGFGGPEVDVPSLVALPILLPLTAVFLCKALDRSPVISVDEHGIWDRRLKRFGRIRWGEIRGAQAADVRSSRYFASIVALEVDDFDRYWREVPRWQRLLGKGDPVWSSRRISLNCTGLDVARDEVLAVVHEHLRRQPHSSAGGSQGSTPGQAGFPWRRSMASATASGASWGTSARRREGAPARMPR